MGSKGWRSDESARLPPMRPGFISPRRRHMWVEFVVGSLLCSERFFSGYSGFPLSSKTSISKFQFDQESGRRRTTSWMCYLEIIIYLFIYLFIHRAVMFSFDLESKLPDSEFPFKILNCKNSVSSKLWLIPSNIYKCDAT